MSETRTTDYKPITTEQYKEQFQQGTFQPDPYTEIKRRASGFFANESIPADHRIISPFDEAVLSQVNIWQSHFPEDVAQMGDYVTRTLKALRTKYARGFYFWTAYKALESQLSNTAVGDNNAQKRSALVQSQSACPGQRAAYVQCTDVYHSIDISTRLTLPVKHQVTCREPFVALEQCLENHLKNWSRTMRSITKLENMPEYTEYYINMQRKIDNIRAASSQVLDHSEAQHLTLFQYDPDFVTHKDVAIEETLFEIKRLFPDEYSQNQSYYDTYKRPLTQEEAQICQANAQLYNIDLSDLNLDAKMVDIANQHAIDHHPSI